MLSSQEGIKEAKVSLADKECRAIYLVENLTAEKVAEIIEDMGFEAAVKSVNGKPVNKGMFKVLEVFF